MNETPFKKINLKKKILRRKTIKSMNEFLNTTPNEKANATKHSFHLVDVNLLISSHTIEYTYNVYACIRNTYNLISRMHVCTILLFFIFICQCRMYIYMYYTSS